MTKKTNQHSHVPSAWKFVLRAIFFSLAAVLVLVAVGYSLYPEGSATIDRVSKAISASGNLGDALAGGAAVLAAASLFLAIQGEKANEAAIEEQRERFDELVNELRTANLVSAYASFAALSRAEGGTVDPAHKEHVRELLHKLRVGSSLQ